ncbi:homocysteine S-methyltransferase family protein [Sphingomonas nostoxanthinifaciens]|uniref:homocysteine S-methyltransferase family protein n=1 Tax=Sphingomonas nostoxanthinifaciens TaxID=2872652 RepID=UPI001CC1F4E7|nr:homocysteine S-methyltransferase family protein [Sphingomonas nostoxanthinifaciens]UAK26399.1 homocysteine S-methyltransferase family protein [Sphingomonas nostoxanthinifaciens]
MSLTPSIAAQTLRAEAAKRILLNDGAFGTMIQSYRLEEADYRGSYDLSRDQKGNNDLLVLTRPDIIDAITRAYLDAGSDIVATNTFNANTISEEDYDAGHLVREMNVQASRIARAAADDYQARDGRPRFVAGAIGPTNKTLSLSPDVNDPGFRAIDFDTLKDVYADQAEALLDGGCDFILIETIFDTLNAKAGIVAIKELEVKLGREIPLMLSMTITDMSGRNLSGHSVEAFTYTVRHARPLTIGLNCAFGADLMRPYLQAMEQVADCLVMAYPNAGLPNELGAYDELPADTGAQIADWADAGLINIVGGCCGTTPSHIAAMGAAVKGKAPRTIATPTPSMRLAGLDPFVIAA